MIEKNKRFNKTEALAVVDDEAAVPAVEEDQTLTAWRTKLAEINKLEGVTGYILRNAASAIIDFKEPAKIFEYAILSSQTLDSSRELSQLFGLGEIENILIKGKDSKVLCRVIGENKVSIFMEKDADHARILSKVLP